MKKIILFLILIIFIIGCTKQEAPIETSISELSEVPAEQAETEQPLSEKEDIEQMPESELQEICEGESWPPDGCGVINDPEGRQLCEKCKALEEEEVEESEIIPDDLTQITFFEGEGVTADPDFSPDGSQIAFCRVTENGRRGLYIVNSDGTGLTEIGPDDVFDPSWSPVDNRILCYGGENSNLYLIDLDKDNTKATLLTDHALYPAWSPDGTKIVYYVYDDSNAPIPFNNPQCDGTGVLISIWIMNSDGTGKTQLTTDEDGYCSDPSFSPDGTKILYNKGFIHPGVPFLVRSENEVWVMNIDGSNKHAIYTPKDNKFYLHQRAWSKNNQIIFDKMQWQTVPQIWVMNSDGTDPRPVARPEERWDAFLYGDTAWDNTGTKIVTTQWKSASEETPEIFVDSNVITFSLEGK
ncbi:MAG: hypothetical protein U9R08_02135 [Nanoarchaeota archaeon]|nr:hypothetical protein [Nanoarchaeota archaeon]